MFELLELPTQDPTIHSLFEVVFQHWPVMSRPKSKEPLEEAQHEPCGQDLLHNDMDDAALAADLGAHVVALPVEPVPDIPDSQLAPADAENVYEPVLDTAPAEVETPMPETESQMMKSFDAPTEDSQMTPTEIEITPQKELPAAVEIMDSPEHKTVLPPVPAPSEREDDLSAVRDKIAALKPLNYTMFGVWSFQLLSVFF